MLLLLSNKNNILKKRVTIVKLKELYQSRRKGGYACSMLLPKHKY